MKTIASLTKNYLSGDFSSFDQGQKVTHVWEKGHFKKLPFAEKNEAISCPMCGESEGYPVHSGIDKNFLGWSCLREECFSNSSATSSWEPPKPTLKTCGVPEEFWEASFENLDQSSDVASELKEFCKSFRGFMLLPGSCGTGKSFASACCLSEFLKNHQDAKFVNIADLFVTWIELKQSGKSEIFLLKTYSEIQLLVLDDLGTRTPSEAFLDFLYLLINQRMGKRSLGTIISTNLNYNELAQKLGDAILSRISSGIIVKFTGKDRRKPKF